MFSDMKPPILLVFWFFLYPTIDLFNSLVQYFIWNHRCFQLSLYFLNEIVRFFFAILRMVFIKMKLSIFQLFVFAIWNDFRMFLYLCKWNVRFSQFVLCFPNERIDVYIYLFFIRNPRFFNFFMFVYMQPSICVFSFENNRCSHLFVLSMWNYWCCVFFNLLYLFIWKNFF